MIIGLTGYAQSGKDTVANILVEKYGFTRVAFADKLRDLLYEFNPPADGDGIPDVQEVVDVNGWDIAKVQYPTIRKQLQDLGLAARKVFGEQFWIQQALREVHFEGNFVITDIRFPNEAAAIRKYDNSQIWRISRNGVKAVNQHISETAMDNEKVDQILMNSGSLEDLNVLINTRMRAYV
jgi:dephospho-CoA kinase